MRQCPRCASELSNIDKKCPRCGMPVSMMNFEADAVKEKQKLSKDEKKAEKKKKKLEKKAERLAKKERESVSNTDFAKYASNGLNESALSKKEQNKKMSSKRKQRLDKEVTPEFELDENGEFYIDTKDTQIIDDETAKIIEEKHTKKQGDSYSVKKARGDYRQPRLKWWEIYKFAERSFAKRKIKKEVNKAAKIKPDFISKTKLLLLAIFLGWTGAHNFYAKNYKRGWVSIISLIVWIGVIVAAEYVPFFASISISIGGFAGFINAIWIWMGDIINIIFGSFKYRIQKEAFIFKMNVETRAKLGEKYIDLDLYKKPWWVRFKAWCDRRKRDWEEDKHERRQQKIQKEKARLAKQAEKDSIDAEIAEAEQKENEKLKQEKEAKKAEQKSNKKDISKLVDASVLEGIKGFDVSGEIDEKPQKPSKPPKQAKIKVSSKNKKTKKK